MLTREEQLQQVRRAKLAALRRAGVDPFGGRFPGRRLAADLHAAFGDASAEELESAAVAVRVAGRVMSLRPHGKAGFGHIQDGSGRIQLYVRPGDLCEAARLVWEALDLGDIVGVDGG